MPGHVRGDVRKAQHDHDAEPCWTPTCAPVAEPREGHWPTCEREAGHWGACEPNALTAPEPTGLPGYTIAPDFAGGAHVWRDDNGRRVPVLSRYHCADARLWEFIVAGIGGQA